MICVRTRTGPARAGQGHRGRRGPADLILFRVVVPNNMSPVVAKADAVNPRLTREWLE
jgi:hypothetical protein